MLPIAELRGAVGRVRKLVRKQSFSFIPWFKRWCRSKPRFYEVGAKQNFQKMRRLADRSNK